MLGNDSVDKILVPEVWEPAFGFSPSNEKTLISAFFGVRGGVNRGGPIASLLDTVQIYEVWFTKRPCLHKYIARDSEEGICHYTLAPPPTCMHIVHSQCKHICTPACMSHGQINEYIRSKAIKDDAQQGH